MQIQNNNYHISIESEYNYWLNNVINKWITINYKCPNCKKKTLSISKYKKSLSNPIKLRCKDKKCKKIVNMRNNTFFAYFKKIPISIIIKIIELFIIDNKNSTEISKYIKEYYQLNSFNNNIIYSVVLLLRKAISHYIKENYYEKMTTINQNANIAVDESLFCHFNGNNQIWLIGLINTETKDFRIEAVLERNSEILEKIIRHHVSIGNNIITDGWSGYNWMDNPNSGFHRIIHVHGLHDFGHGAESTSHIESVWGDMKRLLTKLYVSVKSENFIYFAKECEWRKKNNHLNNMEKISEIIFILNHIADTVQFDLFDKDDIEDFNKNQYNFDLNNSDSSDNEFSNSD